MKLILSTSNVVGGGSAYRPTGSAKSNLEIVSSLQSNLEHHASQSTTELNGDSDSANDSASTGYHSWTRYNAEQATLEIPALDFAQSALEEERAQYDITVKLFFLPGSSSQGRESQIREALRLVLEELHMPSVDLLIASFPGIYFDEEEELPAKTETRGPVESAPEPLENQIATWETLEKLQVEGLVKKLGVAEFGHDRLKSFLSATVTKPGVNQINLRDCCSVPRDLLTLAKAQGVELLVHNDCSNILPRGTVRELLGPRGANILAAASGVKAGEKRKLPHGEAQWSAGAAIDGEVQPQWVVKYTAVVRNRGVVENKGYFAVAEVKQ